jgi:predicted ATP-grasp superfamily ATP-dependent carboligase
MRILVHEFASGGGFAGRPVPRALAREGRAMRTALVADLSALRCHDLVTTADRRSRRFEDLLASVDAVWLIAPETGGCLERLAETVEHSGKTLLGAGSAAIRRAADKARLPRRLARCGVSHPLTRVVRAGADARAIAATIGYPIVVKPSLGAGCCGVSLVRSARELDSALEAAASSDVNAGLKSCATKRVERSVAQGLHVLLQEFVRGVPASVSLLCDGRHAAVLSINGQAVKPGREFVYGGGRTPLVHPLAERGIEAAVRACQALPNLRGYVGVDLVLRDREAVVIEVNPRLTTSYLGVRAALRGPNGDGNIAAMAIEACGGTLPLPPRPRRRIDFTAGGRLAVRRL